MFLQRPLLVITMQLMMNAACAFGCVCPAAPVSFQLQPEIPAAGCCLNLSGSDLNHLDWSVFSNRTELQTLDLSRCNITSVNTSGNEGSSLQRVYLGYNRLKTLPAEFLARQVNLLELDLRENLLEELPEGFLQDSDSLQVLHLQENQLRFLPDSILTRPNLLRLDVGGNPVECSCRLMEALDLGVKVNRSTQLQDLLGNLTCLTPRHLYGRNVFSVRLSDACRPAGLTALFIILPLIILSALVLCWCCGRKRKKKDTPAFGTSKKKTSGSGCNGQQPHRKDPPAAGDQSRAASSHGGGILKNQLLLRPSSTLLGSTRDIYEEVEVKLGSVESLSRDPSCGSSPADGRRGAAAPDGISKSELDTVSVTEVMKDSADREKAYLTQSTEYYSLVPGIELEDSDHGEYEDVRLS